MPPSALAAPPRLQASRLSDRLAAWLVAKIEGGALVPGARLPTEQQLAEQHGVSRTVVREAVHQLKSRGLLISRQGSGVYVAPPAVHKPLDFDPSVLESLEAVAHIVEVRRALEGEIAALAARRASRSQITGLRRALREIEAAVAAGGDGVDQDLALHRAIAEATGNPQFGRLLGFLEQYLREAMRVTRGNEARHQHFADAVRQEHQALVEAIAAGDEQGARAIATGHMEKAADRLVQVGALPLRRKARRESKP